MKNKEKPAEKDVKKPNPSIPAQDGPDTADDITQKTDRPGFDLGGASDDTHAGTGLGLGDDASDTPGDRRLPGRRLDNKLTIPRWSGPDLHGAAASGKKTAGAKSPSAPDPKNTR